MKKKHWPLPLLAFLLLTGSARAHDPGRLFDKVVGILKRHYYDREFRSGELLDIAGRFQPVAERAENLDVEREVIHTFLSEIPVSHLALYSRTTYRKLEYELRNQRMPTFGFDLQEVGGEMFVYRMLDGGPAFEAGLLRRDRVVALDGVPLEESERLDWRSDDAFLPDPPVHQLLCEEGDEVTLLVERRPGSRLSLKVEARNYSSFEAAGASCRIITCDGKDMGYIHFWYIHHEGPAELLRELTQGGFGRCDGLILDLRGRGGNAHTVNKMVSVLERTWHPRPLAVLVDAGTRSAKEVLTYKIRKKGLGLIVGECTAGAVIPATFKKVGEESVLMFPSFTLGRYTAALEGVGIEPDILVRDAGPFSAGADPILEAGIDVLASGRLSTGSR